MAENQARVILWSIPRTVSTAFEKCMSNLEDVQIINEPYVSAFNAGPEMKPLETADLQESYDKFFDQTQNIKVNLEDGWDATIASYKFVKETLLEAEYPGKKVVFVKDMAFAVTYRIDMLPKGYRHAFIIRNPVKVFVSWKKMLNKFVDGLAPDKGYILENKNNIVPDKYAFGESFELYEHLVKTGIEPNPVIIDSDDLLENPELMLKTFCKETGIQYTDKLMKWEAGDGVVKNWKSSTVFIQGNQVFGYYKEAFASHQFNKPSPVPDISELPDDVKVCIDAAMPYYERMYARRLRPNHSDNK